MAGLFRTMLGSTVVTFLYSLRRLLDEFPFFSTAGFTRILRSIHVLLSRVFSLSFLEARFEELNMDEVAALIVDNGSCMYFTVFCWYLRTSRVPTIVGRSAGRSVSGLAAWRSVHSRCSDCLVSPSSCT